MRGSLPRDPLDEAISSAALASRALGLVEAEATRRAALLRESCADYRTASSRTFWWSETRKSMNIPQSTAPEASPSMPLESKAPEALRFNRSIVTTPRQGDGDRDCEGEWVEEGQRLALRWNAWVRDRPEGASRVRVNGLLHMWDRTWTQTQAWVLMAFMAGSWAGRGKQQRAKPAVGSVLVEMPRAEAEVLRRTRRIP
ncbi:unnamed protein product [Discosporangium mesarthrocarpum]